MMIDDSAKLITPSIQKMIDRAEKRGLTAPLLLFLAGHKPLTFITGQMLHFGAPFGALLGFGTVHEWAELLSHPEGPSLLEEELNS